MNNTSTYKFDYILKKYTSYIYRTMIVIVSLFIVFTENNFFNLYIYIFVSLLYIVFIKKNNAIKGIYRLLFDYGYIIFILYNKELYNFLSILLFLLPFINSPNHTSKHKNIILLFLVSFISFCLLYLNNINYETINNITIIGAFIGLLFSSILIYLEYLRNLFIKDIIEGYKKIDSIDFDNSRTSNIPNIYTKIISIMNDELLNKYFVGSKINFITCISLKQEKINIENSSKFILSIDLDNNSIQKLYNLKVNNSILFNVKFKIDGNQEESKNIVVSIEYKKIKFFFILFLTQDFEEPNFIIKIVINDYLYSLFKKILVTINFEEHIRITNLNNTKKILSEIKYVSTTNKSLHTLNNQFTPIKTYFKMLNDYEDINVDLDKKVLERMIKQERIKAENSFNKIVNLSEYLLNKNLNPFSIKKLENIKLKVLYMTLKPIWTEEFSITEILFNLNDRKLDDIFINSNLYLIEILFIDIIQNIKKYSKSEKSVSFEYKDGIISIVFKNDIKSSKERKQLLTNIKLFNDDNKTQLLLKKGHGFSNIKEIITNLNISCEMNLKNDIFEIKIDINEKEK